MRDEDSKLKQPGDAGGVSRREFLKLGAFTVTVPAVVGPRVVEIGGADVAIHGPGKTPMTFTINGKKHSTDLEPRVTLLEALRDHFDLTGAKKVCDRAECGACTVLLDGKSVYACSVLAIEAQGKNITTVEGLTEGERLDALQHAFVGADAEQCGFCTPGFIMSSKAMMNRFPNPTHEQATHYLAGNFCRCGTYHGMQTAMVKTQRPGAKAAAPRKGA